MRDIELYRALLGLTAPWTVAGVDVNMTGQRVVVRVDAGPGPYPCPECRTPGPRYDSKPRRWRHLDTMQFTTWIEAEVPRVACATHGVKQLRVPWAEPGMRAHVIRVKPDASTHDLHTTGLHKHECDFQMFYVLKGWIKFVYEGQGVRTFQTGDCVLQPPPIVHNELECSDDLEVLEIYSPAVHPTVAVEQMPEPANAR